MFSARIVAAAAGASHQLADLTTERDRALADRDAMRG
jgi:hypothetical protein